MIDDPVNPLRSQYAPSFLAAYRSAVHILKTIREQFEIVPELCSRFWSTWTFAFSSAVSHIYVSLSYNEELINYIIGCIWVDCYTWTKL